MPRLKHAQRIAIIQETDSVLRSLLRFHVSYSTAIFLHEDTVSNWRELEERLHQGYPIKGVGVKATRKNLKIIDSEDGGFLHQEELLYPSEVPSELQSFPYEVTSSAYIFTLLEGYGDNLLTIVNPTYLKARQAWHHAVYGDAKLSDPRQLAKAKDGFSKPFNSSAAKVPLYAVQRLVAIKYSRNKFMHDGHTGIDFKEFFASVVATVVFLHFLTLPSENDLSVYPYYDYDEKWK